MSIYWEELAEEIIICYIARKITTSILEKANIAVFHMIKDSLLYKTAAIVFVLASINVTGVGSIVFNWLSCIHEYHKA
jgi:hypothetical protein